MSIFLTLTERFNAGRLRAVICSGQAAVLHRVAIMSEVVRLASGVLPFTVAEARHDA